MPEVVQPNVVGARVATDVREGILFRYPLHPAPDDNGELALVVEKAGSARSPYGPTVPVQRRRRLREIRRFGRRPRRILLDAAAVGQVDGEDLGRLHRRKILGLSLRDAPPAIQNDVLPIEPAPRRATFVQDPYPSSHSNSFRIGYIIQKQPPCQDPVGLIA